ncbi:MAG: hypothetical protein ABI234_08085 [Ktedonobacteraceae bacterium]
MSQFISDPPEEKTVVPATTPLAVPARRLHTRISGIGVVSLLVLIGLSLLLFTGQIFVNLNQAWGMPTPVSALAQKVQPSPSLRPPASPSPTQKTQLTPTPIPTPTAVTPFFTPNNALAPVLQLPANHYVLYQNITHLYLVSTTDETTTQLYTPNYTYNQAVRPILTPSGQLIYSGDQGIWLTDIFDQQPLQIVQLMSTMVITSLVLSQDGTMLAWSTAPLDGNGLTILSASSLTTPTGSLTTPTVVWQHSALDCPCFHSFRIFSFLNGNTPAANTTLLLTDDRGSTEAVQYGLWSLDISTPATQPQAQPQIIMDENLHPQQGPLTLAPYSNVLLYSPNEQTVPSPTDNSVPADFAALSYPNGLSLATLDGAPLALGTVQEALPEQSQKANNALNRWVTTPTFSPDGQTLAYIEFSSDSQSPYDRHSALYTVQVSGSGTTLQVGPPQVIASSASRLLELGPWLNSHVVTLYGDGKLYALDVQSGALTTMSQTGSYARILGVIGTGQT